MQIRVFQPLITFAQRISYQSTCVKIRTSSSGSYLFVEKTTSDSEKFIGRTSGNKKNCCKSGALTVHENKGEKIVDNYNPNHRMPIVAAVVAHRRVNHVGSSTLGSSTAGSKRSSCAVRLSAISILTPPLAAAGLASVCRKATSNYTSGGTFSSASGSCRPIIDLKQLGAFFKGQKSAVIAESRRYYAKGRDKQKTKKVQVNIDDNEMNEVIDVGKLRKQLEALVEEMKDDYTKQLSIRGAAGALEALEVEFDGETFPLQELAQVGRKNPQMAVLNLASLPDAIQPVLKAISESGMNLNPQQEGTTIYVPLPKVTREHRENLAKNAKVLFTKYKTSIQGVQNKYIKQCKSQNEMSQDLVFNVQQQIMKLAEIYIQDAEKLMQVKQKELLENK